MIAARPSRREGLLALALLPIVAMVAIMGALAYRQHSLDVEAELRRYVDTLATGVERQIEQEYGVLIAVASLPWTRTGDFAQLHRFLLALKREDWSNVIITDRERQLFNLRRWPDTLELRDPRSLAQTFEGRGAVVGPLRNGLFSLRAPIVVDGKVEMTVTAVLKPTALAQVLRLHGLPPGWVAVVVDEEGRVIARNIDPERYVGQAATQIYLDAVRAEGGKAFEAVTLDGRDALILARTLGHGAWSVGIAAPRSDLAARWLRTDRLLFVTALGVTGAALIALAFAVFGLSRRREAERQALQLVAASDARFRDGIESMGDGLQLWDADGRLVAWNSRYLEFYPMARDIVRPGIRQEELVGQLLRRMFPNASSAEVDEMVSRRVRGFRAHVRPWERRLPDGRVVEISERETSDGGTVSLFRDVTADRAATAQIALSEARFHDFAALTSDWFWETDAEHRFTYLSFGPNSPRVDPSRAIGRTREEWARELGVPVPEGYRTLAAMMARQEPFSGFAYETLRWDTREPRVVELYGKPVRDEHGRFTGYRGTGRDVTELKRQEMELQRALTAEREMNAEQRRFVAIASHEFRTPLTIIDGAAQRIAAHVVSGRNFDTDEVGKRLARIRNAVAQMTGIIDRTLSSARLEAGRIEMQAQRFDLGELLREVSARQRQATPDFEIAVDVPDIGPVIVGDPKLLEHVFSNLVSNAVKYSGAARRIEIDVDAGDAMVEVRVRDHGLGVPSDEVPKLFTRFFRARTAMGISGTGIGLHLVREFVTLHGGEVDVQSEVGHGSTFRVILPVGIELAAIAS